ncbi:MAG: YaiI/YqxD family protein [Ruminococcus sp.]|nr:YaiI/YqxD family protein [Ruminococcus sp.]
MRILIDADGCPVVKESVRIAKEHGLECVIVADTAHRFESDYARVICVDQGADSADLRIANLCEKGDVVITQDYGLAALCIGKNSFVLDQNGMEINAFNIDSLLQSRYESKRLRNAGVRLKGPAKRKTQQTKDFIEALEQLIERNEV